VPVDIADLDAVLTSVLSARRSRGGQGRRGTAPADAADLTVGWKP